MTLIVTKVSNLPAVKKLLKQNLKNNKRDTKHRQFLSFVCVLSLFGLSFVSVWSVFDGDHLLVG
jgi:hypothetical protein